MSNFILQIILTHIFFYLIILGIKIINPIIAAAIAETSTAPAAMSLAFLAFSFISGIAISTVVSIAEFTSSNDITNPNNIIHKCIRKKHGKNKKI